MRNEGARRDRTAVRAAARPGTSWARSAWSRRPGSSAGRPPAGSSRGVPSARCRPRARPASHSRCRPRSAARMSTTGMPLSMQVHVDPVDARRARCRSAAARRSVDPAVSRKSIGIGAAVPGTPSIPRVAVVASTRPPGRLRSWPPRAVSVFTMWMRDRRRCRHAARPGRARSRTVPTPARMLPQFCAVVDPRLVDDDLQEQIVDVDVGSRWTGRRPRPCWSADRRRRCRRSGADRASPSPPAGPDRAGRRFGGRSEARKYAPLDVPPRIIGVQGIAALASLSLPSKFGPIDVAQAPAPRACRACRRCRGRARRPASRARLSPSFASRSRGLRATASAALARHDHDAVVVGHDHVARVTRAGRAQTTGTLTEPSVSLTVPCAETGRDQTGKLHLGQLAHVAAAGLDHQARARRARERGGEQLAEIAVVARRGRAPPPARRPARHCSTATWIIQLSAGAQRAR